MLLERLVGRCAIILEGPLWHFSSECVIGISFLQQSTLPEAFTMDYYCIDSILAEEEKLKVKFSHEVENFGFYLGPTHSSIKRDAKVDLPFFLIKFLLLNEYCCVVEHPLKTMKHDLDAGAVLVDLKNRYFYTVNMHIYDRKYLFHTFFERIGSLITLLPKGDFSEDDVAKLSSEEKKIIVCSRRVFVEFENYYSKKGSSEL
ncbi:uncharacterized protein VICG_01975 [Vittaforma corneae ATCC 50505]|uniref:DNA replication complex GINS protein PSF3 n=1 Tax=Vittaforma corneae (strain ATCC 50505) TaxID=993615 RepID=L2GJH8_VITCO|nr:uncharacterized protein VICG_01975 [Vittaforma corneae ATCC 50505]ELA41016.1 hypothetical protein VICG_01975 [Vittaforma corneae ATCC 50505]